MKTKTVKCAVYVSGRYSEMVNECCDWIEGDEGYTRITEQADVEFSLLDREEVLKLRLAGLDREIESVRANAAQKIKGLEDEKQRLMVITDQSDE